MKEFSSYMVVLLAIMFWILRIVVSITNAMYIEFPIIPSDANLEIILLFAALVCIILIVKRQMVGAFLYLVIYGVYFGNDVSGYITKITGGATLSMNEYTTLFVSIIGIILPIVVLLEMAWDKHRTKNPVNKKTDWFYKNKEYDREMDERADKNNYRTL